MNKSNKKISIEKIKEILEKLRDDGFDAVFQYLEKIGGTKNSTPEADELRAAFMMSTHHINTLLLQIDGHLPEDLDYHK